MNFITTFLSQIPKSIIELSWKYILPVLLLFIVFSFLKGFFWEKNKIQSRQLKQKFIMHEVRWWLTSMLIALFFLTFGYFLIETNISQVYTNINEFGIWYLPVSFLIILVIHDTYFYWLHKLIHNRKVYKRLHSLHHYSPTPTPFDGFAVTPSEAIAELAFLPILSLILPMYIGVFVAFGGFYVFFNSYLHLGYEVLPKFWVKTAPFKYINTAVHHDQHHSMIRYNFSLYFNIWDRVMGTLNPKYEELYLQVKNGEKYKELLAKEAKLAAAGK